MGNGLITSNGAFHARQRRLVQPAFHHRRLVGYTETLARAAEAHVASWRDGDHVELHRALMDLTFATAAEVMFSARSTRPAEDTPVARMMADINAGILPQALLPAPLTRVPLPANRRYRRAIGELHNVIDETVSRYRVHGPEHDDLLYALTAARDEDGQAMPDAQIRDEVVNLMPAGAETTATVLAWAFHHIARDPDVERRLADEVAEVRGDRPPRHADLDRLTYTQRVLRETARLHPLALIMRRSNAPAVVAGIPVPPGVEFVVSHYAIHRDARLYDDPLAFRPERWLAPQSAALPKGAYAPFGSGARKCIGDHFAWLSMTVVVATVLRRHRLVPEPGHAPREVPAAHPHLDRLPMTVRPRRARPGGRGVRGLP
ncbi:cytochrome P450 [Streptodolium elevatio]|uniref:Cytochrome P450 n=1 Tax=Streptodolium elevatio TaxID=3157996 RepID=A0ABV3DL86_9ACTN